ncbi:MAG TPA: hypothetical protein VFI13_03190, partial [Gemmatimonadales bacterium]|nr:hypothetical protein [Gemmatimonadales bacterium]
MRRILALLTLLAAGLPARAAAQGNALVHLTVGLDSARATQQPVIHTEDLLDDPRVGAMLASGFPLRLHYRLQVW